MGALLVANVSLKITPTISQNPFAALPAEAKSGQRVTLSNRSRRDSSECSGEARESFCCVGQHCLHTIAG